MSFVSVEPPDQSLSTCFALFFHWLLKIPCIWWIFSLSIFVARNFECSYSHRKMGNFIVSAIHCWHYLEVSLSLLSILLGIAVHHCSVQLKAKFFSCLSFIRDKILLEKDESATSVFFIGAANYGYYYLYILFSLLSLTIEIIIIRSCATDDAYLKLLTYALTANGNVLLLATQADPCHSLLKT